MASSYYKNGKRVTIDGVPCKVAAWVGELGNDREALEAAQPRSLKYSKAYYEGGARAVYYGVPVRLSAIGAELSSRAKAMLFLGTIPLKGAAARKETWAMDAQLVILFPGYVPRGQPDAACSHCRTPYSTFTKDTGSEPPCWASHMGAMRMAAE